MNLLAVEFLQYKLMAACYDRHTNKRSGCSEQLFKGTPVPHLISFMQVSDVEKMHQWIVSKGWKQVTEMVMEPWGSKTFVLTTIDGYTIKVFG